MPTGPNPDTNLAVLYSTAEKQPYEINEHLERALLGDERLKKLLEETLEPGEHVILYGGSAARILLGKIPVDERNLLKIDDRASDLDIVGPQQVVAKLTTARSAHVQPMGTRLKLEDIHGITQLDIAPEEGLRYYDGQALEELLAFLEGKERKYTTFELGLLKSFIYQDPDLSFLYHHQLFQHGSVSIDISKADDGSLQLFVNPYFSPTFESTTQARLETVRILEESGPFNEPRIPIRFARAGSIAENLGGIRVEYLRAMTQMQGETFATPVPLNTILEITRTIGRLAENNLDPMLDPQSEEYILLREITGRLISGNDIFSVKATPGDTVLSNWLKRIGYSTTSELFRKELRKEFGRLCASDPVLAVRTTCECMPFLGPGVLPRELIESVNADNISTFEALCEHKFGRKKIPVVISTREGFQTTTQETWENPPRSMSEIVALLILSQGIQPESPEFETLADATCALWNTEGKEITNIWSLSGLSFDTHVRKDVIIEEAEKLRSSVVRTQKGE